MAATAIFGPVIALVAWTFIVLLLLPFRRFRAGLAKQVRPSDFKYGESANVPPEVSIPNRNYMNLLEAPVLFYVACLTAYTTHAVGHAFVAMAWMYVALRVLHSLVHLSYNNVVHRLTIFVGSNIVLVMMWTRLGMQIFQQG